MLCHGSEQWSLGGEIEGFLKERCKKSACWMGWREPALGLVDVVPCGEVAGGTSLWKLLPQVKPGALGIRETFPSGLRYAELRSSCCPLYRVCRSCVLGHGILVPLSGTLNTFRATESHDVAPWLFSVPPDTPTEGAVGTLCLPSGPWLCKEEMFLSKAQLSVPGLAETSVLPGAGELCLLSCSRSLRKGKKVRWSCVLC